MLSLSIFLSLVRNNTLKIIYMYILKYISLYKFYTIIVFGLLFADLNYTFITTEKCVLLMLNKYTYAKHCKSDNYYCSKKTVAGCKARFKLVNDTLFIKDQSQLNHNHDPPHYVRTSTGTYIKMSS